MKILIIGGTRFVGRHLVEAALAQGHQVTLFNRGRSNAGLFPQVEKLLGNRENPRDLEELAERHWDAIIDTCGYVPRVVRLSAEKLAEATNLYVFISTLSVFRDFKTPNMDENGPLGKLDDPTVEDITNDTYGPLKVLCEQAVTEILPERNLIIRPGIIVGPYDPSDRFTYWPHRVAQGGEVLAPGQPENPLLYIDARDLGEWIVRLVGQDQTGIYNAYGPDYPLTMAQFLNECKKVSGSDATFTWVEETFLKQHEVFDKIPLWFSAYDEDTKGLATINSGKAQAAGLSYRPLAQTIQDTLTWDATRDPHTTNWDKLGLNPRLEQQLLAEWHNQTA